VTLNLYFGIIWTKLLRRIMYLKRICIFTSFDLAKLAGIPFSN
jgi:hypothetical protein